MLDNLVTLGFLVLLQAVLGFDNLLYISLASKRAPADRRSTVRHWGIGLAIALRIGLLFVVIKVIALVSDALFHVGWSNVIEGSFTLHSLIVLFGGVFVLYTAVKEIWHMVSLEEDVHDETHQRQQSITWIIAMIVVMNLVFSFDSILSALALTDVFWVMATAIVIGGLMMIWLADRISAFLQKNRMYEVLGLFILLIVGVMLLTEGGHLAHLHLFGAAIMPMTKATFYFVIGVLVLTDIAQSRYKRKLVDQAEAARAD